MLCNHTSLNLVGVVYKYLFIGNAALWLLISNSVFVWFWNQGKLLWFMTWTGKCPCLLVWRRAQEGLNSLSWDVQHGCETVESLGSPFCWCERVMVNKTPPGLISSHTYYYGNANFQGTGTFRAATKLECVSGGDGTGLPHFSLQSSSACEDVPFSFLFLCCAQNSPRAPVHHCLLVVSVLACWQLRHPSVPDDTIPQ